MLSPENHSPTDSNEISLKRVDLINSSLDDHNPAPKFSIRDFVFNARSKDIETNWPFSQKSLQLCLDHGVKDLLPPFQCLDCVKNWPRERDGVESSSSVKGKIMNMDSEIIIGSVKSVGLESRDTQIPVTINIPLPQEVYTKPPQTSKARNINPNGFDSCNEYLPVTEVSPKTPEKSKTHFPKKPEMSKPSSMKKCRLTLKVGLNGVEPSSNPNTGSTMAEPLGSSKLCPVCKKCSFSSNTTLNAHIDQCLSMDSPIEPVSKSMLTKHRIKPKKTRLMVDIYAAAPHCTIEELDRRNGRTWIEKPSLLLTIQEDDERDYGEEKKKKVDLDEKGDDGVVYIDSNGTKVRILNKISDTSLVPKLGVSHCRLGNSLKGDKSKKKKKHTKYLKLVASQRGKTCSYKTRLASRVLEDQEKAIMTLEESLKKDKNIDRNATQISKSREKINNSETLLPKWGSSNKTDLLERRFKRDLSVDNSYLERSSAQKSKRIDNSSCEGPIDNNHEQPPSKKQVGFKSFVSQSINSMDKTVSPSRKQILSVDQSSLCEPKLRKINTFGAKNDDHYNEKLQRRVDEDVGEVRLKRSTILKIKKKKSPAIISQGNESTHDRDSCEILPSPRVSSHFEDNFFYAKHPARGGEIVIGQSPGTDSANVMSLAKSFDQGFYSICDTDMETDNDVGNYFSGVDPITIPGPPGSFLPSPGRSSSDEDHHGNSSLTTSQLQSSVDLLKTGKRDSSDSPKSANSAVSNSLIEKSDLKSTENMSQDEIIKLAFSDKITKSTFGFEDSQPCCCSRKEDILVNCQESQLMRRRVMSSFPDPIVDNPSRFSQDSTVFTRAESGLGPVSVKVPIKPSVYGDFGSPSPSVPSPVLRLMGKNLVVVNNDENINQSPNLKFQTGSSDNHLRQINPPSYGHKGIDLDLHENKPNFSGLNRSFSNSFSPLRYNQSERVETLSDPFQNAIHTDGMNVIRTSSGGFPIPLSGYYNSGNLNPFHNYPGTEFLNYRDPHMIPNVSSPLSHSTSGPMRWNNSVLEGSSVLPQSSLTSSPSTNRARSSSLYFSPSMS